MAGKASGKPNPGFDALGGCVILPRGWFDRGRHSNSWSSCGMASKSSASVGALACSRLRRYSYSSAASTTTASCPRHATNCRVPSKAALTTARKRFWASGKVQLAMFVPANLNGGEPFVRGLSGDVMGNCYGPRIHPAYLG